MESFSLLLFKKKNYLLANILNLIIKDHRISPVRISPFQLWNFIIVSGNENIHKIKGRIRLHVVRYEDDSIRENFIFKVNNWGGRNDSIFNVLNFSLFFIFLQNNTF